MKRIVLTALGLALVAFALVSCASTSSAVSSLASNPLVSSLTSGLGLNATQGVAAAGALLGSAQSQLTPDQWKTVSNAVPGTDALVSEAKNLTGTTGSFGSVSSLSSSFSKLGISPEVASQLTPTLTSAVSKISPEAGSILSTVLR
jgi:hypothetical protein